MKKLIVALLFIGLNLYVYRFFASEDFIPERDRFAAFPMQVNEWHCPETETMADDILRRLGVTDYLLCNYVDREAGRVANVYAGYHETQTRTTGGNETIIHPPEHCLPGAGWDIIENDIVPIQFGRKGEAKRVVVAKGNARSLVYFWYQSRGRVIARNHEKVVFMFLDRATMKRTDGSLIRFTVPIRHGDVAEAELTFASIANALMPLLSDYIPN
jgi:EpsI family protein